MRGWQHSWRVVAALAAAAVPAGGASQTPAAEPDLVSSRGVLQSRTIVGVVPLEGSDARLASDLTQLLSVHLSKDTGLDLVERGRLSQVLEEQGLGQSGLVDPATAQHIGYLAGAQALIMGQVFELDRDVYMVGRVVGVETGRVFVRESHGPLTQKIAPIAKDVADQLIRVLHEHRRDLRARDIAADGEALLERLADSLRQKAKPNVAIDIPETHFGAPIPDPAGETELVKWLKRAGFSVFDVRADQQSSDVRVLISGEAFSELAYEYGPFKVAKVRIEVRVVNRTSREILTVARRVGVMADLSERAAAKQGLSNAAASIAYELLPKLASYDTRSD